jgi:hypothetical protein
MQSKYIACVYLSVCLPFPNPLLFVYGYVKREKDRKKEWVRDRETENLTHSAEVALSGKGSHIDLSVGIWDELVWDIVGKSLCDFAKCIETLLKVREALPLGPLASLLVTHTAFFCLSRYLFQGELYFFLNVFFCLYPFKECYLPVHTICIKSDLYCPNWLPETPMFNLVRYKIVFNLKMRTPPEGARGFTNITRALWMRSEFEFMFFAKCKRDLRGRCRVGASGGRQREEGTGTLGTLSMTRWNFHLSSKYHGFQAVAHFPEVPQCC